MNACSQPNLPTWPNDCRAAVSLTFDDARLTQIDAGMSILDRYDVKATFYVSFPTLEQRLDAWRQAVAHGHEIGNHTLTHPCSGNFEFVRPDRMLEDFSLERMERELLGANEKIHALLAVQPTTFAYPCGQTFVGSGTQRKSYVPLIARHFAIGRIAFDEQANDPYYCDPAAVSGLDLDCLNWDEARALIELAIEQGRWLVLFGHEVGTGGRQVTLADTLDKLCQHCCNKDHRIWIDTVANIGRHVSSLRNATT
jgi:peptidoglycan/xylan/chitin deacetylase (PgdA/CDA1 family)